MTIADTNTVTAQLLAGTLSPLDWARAVSPREPASGHEPLDYDRARELDDEDDGDSPAECESCGNGVDHHELTACARCDIDLCEDCAHPSVDRDGFVWCPRCAEAVGEVSEAA